MAENKTKKNQASVKAFLDSVEHPQRRKDARELLALMKQITGKRPKMWGPSIVGFGEYHYKYESGREGDMLATGFSPRKQALSLYIMSGFSQYGALLKKLGKFKTGKSCLYVNKLDDVDKDVLAEMIKKSYEHITAKYS